MEGFITVKEAANKWGVSVRSVQSLCAGGKIVGATKVANVWVIPFDAEYPIDRRLKSGQYVNWRKTTEEKER